VLNFSRKVGQSVNIGGAFLEKHPLYIEVLPSKPDSSDIRLGFASFTPEAIPSKLLSINRYSAKGKIPEKFNISTAVGNYSALKS